MQVSNSSSRFRRALWWVDQNHLVEVCARNHGTDSRFGRTATRTRRR